MITGLKEQVRQSRITESMSDKPGDPNDQI